MNPFLGNWKIEKSGNSLLREGGTLTIGKGTGTDKVALTFEFEQIELDLGEGQVNLDKLTHRVTIENDNWFLEAVLANEKDVNGQQALHGTAFTTPRSGAIAETGATGVFGANREGKDDGEDDQHSCGTY